MTFLELKNEILDQNLCTSCGACVAACSPRLLEISVDAIVPHLGAGVTAIDCGSCNECLSVCPGKYTDVAASETILFGRRRTESERWTGVMGQTYLAAATDETIRGAASAGGAVTSLLASSLHSGLVDGCLVIGRDEQRPWVPVPRIVTSDAELLETAQASYCITPNLQLLRDTTLERIAVVGLACQIQAIQKWRRSDPDGPAAKVALTIELACSSNTLRTGTEHLIQDQLRLPLTDVTRMRYRHGDYPGAFTAWDGGGETHSLPFHKLVLAFREHKTFRCQSCPDWWSGLADISVADGDANIFRTSKATAEGEAAPEKLSLLVTRTQSGATAVARAVDRGDLHLTPSEFVPAESLGLQRKVNRYASYARQFPGAVPHAPLPGAEVDNPKDDNDVISELSRTS
ncbi:Coenzyme F420 hydrogenase/dehydrogenase, beta subunit C-terminal domain [Rhodococcus tibetensis]|uniref:Coenzyme F420 hydrogenase/dehydrogenase, beta subunit C-terminal domain n=1 Tax=Rhodococcus tibetensis TaxID=2965064 RepID=A0ABT1QJC6_9NOCA|nr:Coenzyme F420 hydrogenase/dehydrogenase, beta subunit C-terminal domain [Rhodococcus sp. FXJ9.536]MCQ4122375.1 Coenzyme F420 hydrogenase/dehydrogenase, beta subunit C-terminal domain [Rhodococcus sp. FXJ9.536]